MWAKFQSVYFPALPRESPENSIKARGQLGQQKCSRLAAVQRLVANTENSPLPQKEKNEIHEAHWPLRWLSLSLFTWSGVLNVPPWLLQSEMPPRGAVRNAEPRSHACDSPVYWGGLHILRTSEVTHPIFTEGSVSCTAVCALSRCFNVKGIKAGYFQRCAKRRTGLFLPYLRSN